MSDPLAMWLETVLGKAISNHIKNGLWVFPLHGINDDLSCTCGENPCGKDNKNAGKHPHSKTAPNGLLNATDNIEIASEMFEYRDDLNIGVATGKKSGIVVIDVDNKNSNAGDESLAKIQEVLGYLPATMCLTTGNGYHLVFDYPEGGLKTNSKSFGSDYPDLDIRADGGYIVIYPSRHFSGRYYEADSECGSIADLPQLYLDFLRADRSSKNNEQIDRYQSNGEQSEWTEEQIADALTYLDADMAYLDWIFIGMGLHREGFSLDMWDKWSSTGTKYHGIGDLNLHWKSFKSNGTRTIGTIIDWAMIQGWQPKSDYPERMASDEAESMVAPFIEKIKAKKNILNEENFSGILDAIKESGIQVFEKSTSAQVIELPSKKEKEEKTPYVPQFSFNPLELPGGLGETIRWITKHSIYDQPELAMLNVLAFAGTVFGRRYASPLDTRTNLYLVGIARTGGGKDHSRKMINKLAMESGLSSYIGGNSVRSDTGMLRGLVNNSAQILQLDEFGIFMQALSDNHAPHHVKAISRTLMSLYSDSNSVYHHGDYADAKAIPIKIAAPNLCIYGTTTEESYIPALKRSALKSGELNRFIVIPSRIVPTPKRGVPPKESDPILVEWWNQFAPNSKSSIGILANSATIVPKPITVGWGDCEEYQYQLNLEQVARANEDTPTRDLWSRLMENTIKIAMIFAIARDMENPEFCQTDFDCAYSIVRVAIDYVASLIEDCIMETPQEQNHHEVLKAIIATGDKGLTRRDALRMFRRFRKRDIDDLISTMVEEEAVTVGRIVPKSGRPQVVYYSSDAPIAKTISKV